MYSSLLFIFIHLHDLSSLRSSWHRELISTLTVKSHRLTVFVSLSFLSLHQRSLSPLLTLSFPPVHSPAHPSQQSCQQGVFACVCAYGCVCVNETDKSTQATPPTPNQTWKTNEICMLSNLFPTLLAVVFCRSFSRKVHFKTDKQLTVCCCMFFFYIILCIISGLPSFQGQETVFASYSFSYHTYFSLFS